MLQLRRAFTLVEILIVVVILGILAAIVTPQFVNARDEAAMGTTVYELEKIRRAIDVYMSRNNMTPPDATAGLGTWGALTGNTGEYLKAAPRNSYVGQPNAQVIVLGNAPDAAFQRTHGWIYDPATGSVWAGSFDADDEPYAP